MCKIISTLGMEREAWLQLRKGGIGVQSKAELEALIK